MKANQDLIGKTITGVVAVNPPDGSARELWLLQFSDGTHVEFVSPRAKQSLRRAARGKKRVMSAPPTAMQLALNVA